MKKAFFKNFSDEPFTGGYDGRTKTFDPGAKVHMPAYLAKHLAKHLANRELIKLGKVTATSPKKPAEVPDFMNMFNLAFIPDNTPDDDFGDFGDSKSLDVLINSASNQRAPLPEGAKHMENLPDQIIEGPSDDESEFQ